MKSFMKEFKAFAMKGNVMDLAVAVVIGGAFGKIVTSLVDNIITPAIGLFMGGVDFSGYSHQVGDAVITYGKFVQSVVDFIIVALVIFLVVKAMNKAKVALERDGGEKEEKSKEPAEEIVLLREIRDSLKK
ncbi:MAG: large conductance mechanosensitive channel protein MscL [Candidatus Parcubacteria bacterium]|jgi:large conductance mechanosensitive channel